MVDKDNQLLDEIKNSIMDMQQQMQSTYSQLTSLKIVGKSHDGTVVITMTATYGLEDLEFGEAALRGGVKEFKWRMREAWKDVCEQIQKTTQNKTLELLQSMNIPEEIKSIAGEGGEGSQG